MRTNGIIEVQARLGFCNFCKARPVKIARVGFIGICRSCIDDIQRVFIESEPTNTGETNES